MKRTKEFVSEEEYEFGVLCSGRRYKRRKTRVEKGESCSEPEWRGPCATIQILEIPHIKGEEDEFQFSPMIKYPSSPTQTRSCVESMNPCVSPQLEIIVKYLSKVAIVIKGRKSSNNQSSGSSA
jgi:hypothetical protein